MDSLPPEILELILLCNIHEWSFDKNKVLDLRFVCKAFDNALKPYVFKTVQLEFSRFLKGERAPKLEALARQGGLCEALYLDLMVVRDDEEISRLQSVFLGVKVPAVEPLLDSLRKYSLSADTFDEVDFQKLVENVIQRTPNMKRLKLNLPFQVVGQKSRTATMLLATTLACVNQRPEEHKTLETLVLDHISDTTVVDICNNPIDLRNTMTLFGGLEHLVMSIKRQESRPARQHTFNQNVWFLIRKAYQLKSLCMVGWNTKRNIATRKHTQKGIALATWHMRSLPFYGNPSLRLKNLRYLELKRIDIEPSALLGLIREIAPSLKELYLKEVYLKVRGVLDREAPNLWIGYTDIPRPEDCCWLAPDIRAIKWLDLKILRATGLGYDDFEPDMTSAHPDFDLKDPSETDISFDQRFVEAVVYGPPPSRKTDFELLLEDKVQGSRDRVFLSPEQEAMPAAAIPQTMASFDADTFQENHNTTSQFKRCIDGIFLNHNGETLKVLQNIINIADKGMSILSSELDAGRAANQTQPPAQVDGVLPDTVAPPAIQAQATQAPAQSNGALPDFSAPLTILGGQN